MKPPFPEYDPKREDPKSLADADAAADAAEPPKLFDEGGGGGGGGGGEGGEGGAGSEGEEVAQISRLRDVPFRMLVPNLITLGAICSGLTSVRLAWEDRYELAIVAIVFAAVLDALDGRVARFLKSSSSFGEQLDSLADFVNFGVAPALVLYLWTLHDLKNLGWMVALIFAICGCLRLARFNVMLDDPDRPGWQVDFFTGVPAPAGALLVLLPLYLGLLGLESSTGVSIFTAFYMLLIGFLMVSSIPSWSGKRAGARVSRGLVLPVMLGLMMTIVVLFSYPWETLTCFAVIYLSTIPFSLRDWNKREARDAIAAATEDK
ncbi:MAG: CDP-diacylglycerol--serine O-phosphatidyltransferase [Rhizobiaceae bacterium]